jgi:ribosomal-protein-alanine N-acetyltransferase
MMDDLDRIMLVMEAAFDPAWNEAWSRRQVSDSLMFAHTHYRLLGRAEAGLPENLPNSADEPAGFTLVRAAPGEEELLLIAVIPALRGKGLGRRLLHAVLEDARSRGASQMFLEMRDNNPAEGLYRSVGFEPIGRRKDYYRLPNGNAIDAITFARKL